MEFGINAEREVKGTRRVMGTKLQLQTVLLQGPQGFHKPGDLMNLCLPGKGAWFRKAGDSDFLFQLCPDWALEIILMFWLGCGLYWPLPGLVKPISGVHLVCKMNTKKEDIVCCQGFLLKKSTITGKKLLPRAIGSWPVIAKREVSPT